MVSVIGELLPLMLAVALSSVPIMVTLTILLGPRSGSRALAFLIGWLLGIVLVTALFTIGFQALPAGSSWRNRSAVAAGEIVVGSALLAYGILLLVRKPAEQARTELPKWFRAAETMNPAASFGLALLLNIRPKALLLATAAALIIGSRPLSTSATIAVLLIYAVIGGSTVSVPIVLALARPEMMRRPLAATERWLAKNSRTVTLLVLVFVGVVVLGNGMADL
jgi:hypothetical protein